MILKIHPSGAGLSRHGTTNFICGQGNGEEVVMEVANSLGEGGGRVRCARRSRIESILESMVD